VAFNARLLICKAFNGAGETTTDNVVDCLNWSLLKGAKVVSMSWHQPDSTALHQAIKNVFQLGLAQGALMLAAAGNAGNSTVNFPAGYAEVVSVAATDRNDAHAAFSQTNADVEVSAPGVDILSTLPGNSFGKLTGTSMSTPHAAGVAAAIRARFPGTSVNAARTTLTSSTDDLGPASRDSSFGFGRVNLCKALGGACTYTPGDN
jgi:subtilisin family serine protease